MVLAEQLRLALMSLNIRVPRKISLPLICNRVTRFDITPPKHPNSRLLCSVYRAHTDELMFKILRTSNGYKIVNAQKKLLYYAIRNRQKEGLQIIEANSDHVLFTALLRGQLFSIIDVFHGNDGYGPPFFQVCGASDYDLTENESGRVLAVVRRTVRWHQVPTCSVVVDAGLNAAVFILLISIVNESSRA